MNPQWTTADNCSSPVWCSLVYQSLDGSVQTIEGNVLFDPYAGGQFTRKNGEVYVLCENWEYATHYGFPFDVPDPAPDAEIWADDKEGGK